MWFIGLDDTDNLESRGTGHLARDIAAALGDEYRILGVTRHQLLLDPRVRYTRHNSSAALLMEGNGRGDLLALVERVQALMVADYEEGSDPGLCVARQVPAQVVEFGRRAKREIVTEAEARELAAESGIPLVGLGGDESGVIGALAAVGLAASGEDGRYPLVGRSRELSGLQPVAAVLAAGIAAVQTVGGQPVLEGLVQCDKLRPARRGGKAVLFVEWAGAHWEPVKVD